jgi:hypothetical protein
MSSPILSKLRAVRRKHGLVAIGVAVVAVIGIAAVCLAGGMAIDRWVELRYGFRAVLLTVYSALVLWAFYRLAILALWRRPTLERAALWVEHAEPVFRSRLISTVQFLKPVDEIPPGSPAMVRHVIRETETLAAPMEFGRVVRTDRLRRLAVVVAVVIACLLGGAVYAGPQSIPLLERALLIPGIPMPRRTQIQILDTNQTIARGETVTLTAIASGEVPPSGTVHLAYDTGEAGDFALPADRNKFTRTIGNVQSSFSYTIKLGDNTAGPYRVRVVLRPAVVDVRCVQVYPAYTGHPDQPRSPWDLSLLTGSRLKIAVKSSVPGKASADPAGCRVRLAGTGLVFPLVGSINDLTDLHAVDGIKSDIPLPAGTTGFTVELIGPDGIWSDDPTLRKITLTPDQPPVVRITAPEEHESTVTPVARAAITIEATDDYAVGRADLKYRMTRAGRAAADQTDPHGLTGTYFSDPELVGHSVERIDPAIDLNWATTPPPPGIGPAFGVRWSGFLRPVFGEPTQFTVRSTDGFRLWVDGNLLLDQWTRGGQTDTKPVLLEPGRSYSIRFEVRATTPAGAVRLGWKSRRMQQQLPIPHASLFHHRPADPPADLAGLVDAWPCDDTTPGFVHDAIGTANGVVYNAPRVNGAVLFEGQNDQKVEIASTPNMSFFAADSFTLTAAVNPREILHRPEGLVTKSREAGTFYGLWIDAAGRWAAFSPRQQLTGPAATPGLHHLALVQDGQAGKRILYVDGLPVATGTSENADAWGAMVIGAANGSNDPFAGTISDVRLYARAVPADQLKAWAADPKPVSKPVDTAADPNAADSMPIPLAAPSASVRRSVVWDLSALPSPPSVGDTIEFWAEAADTNDVSGPGVGSSGHYTFKVISAEDKQKEVLDKLGDYLGQIHEVSDDQRDLTTKVGEIAKPKRP